MDIHALRKQYRLKRLDRSDLEEDPLDLFRLWMDEALRSEILEPNAFTLATASKRAVPSCRTLLLKGMDDRGFSFFTNTSSRKGHDLAENPQAVMLFLWKELERQVTVEGSVLRLSDEEAYAYFQRRPRGSQIGAWISEQGKVIEGRRVLEESYLQHEKDFEGKEIPLPPHWGGFRLIPTRIEFWQGRENRLHDRFQYLRQQDAWRVERLSP